METRDACALALALACATLASATGTRVTFIPRARFDASATTRVAFDGAGRVVMSDGDGRVVTTSMSEPWAHGGGGWAGGTRARGTGAATRGGDAAIAAWSDRGRGGAVVVVRNGTVVAYDGVGRETWRARGVGGGAEAAVARGGGLVVVGARVAGVDGVDEGDAVGVGDAGGGATVRRARAGALEYAAFDATTGETRWRANAGDEDVARAAVTRERSELIVLDDDEVEDARARSCADFRESIVRDGLPHQWRYEGDTTLRFARFKRHASSVNEARGGGVGRGRDTRRSRDPSAVPANAATRAFGRAVDALRGTRSTRRSSAARRDAKAEEQPNVVVAHHSEGVDILHLHSGAVLCSLELKSPGLHVDADGDGIMDHVEAHGKNSARDDVPSCWATVTSGVASEGRTLSASVCRGGSGLAAHRAAQAAGFDLRSVELTPPISLRRLPETASEFAKGPDGLGRDLIFLNSRGEMTCFNARDGEQRRWQIRTTAEWNADGSVVPSLTSFPLHSGGRLDLAVAVGAKSIVVINSKGYRAAPPIDIPAPPAAPLIVADVDGDGLTDLVLRTQNSIYVWTQKPRAGNLPLTFLILTLAVTMVLAFARELREALANGKTAVVRSTSLDVDELDARDAAHPDSDSDSDSAPFPRSKRL